MNANLRAQLLVGGAILAAVVLVGAYLAAGGSSYAPEKIQDPCEPREWRDPGSLQGVAEQFSLSALDGAACELGVSREALAQALPSEETRERFRQRYGIDDAKFAEAIRAGLLRAVTDAEDADALSPLLGEPLRATVEEIPIEQAIDLIEDASSAFESFQDFLGPAGDLLEEILPSPGWRPCVALKCRRAPTDRDLPAMFDATKPLPSTSWWSRSWSAPGPRR